MNRFFTANLSTVVVGCLFATAAFEPFYALGDDEPVYKGKSVAVWVNDQNSMRSAADRAETRKAIAQFGTNALPFLMNEVRILGEIEDRGETNLDRLHEQQIRFANVHVAFMILGPVARPAVPELASMVNQGKGPFVAARILSVIDTNDAAVVFVQALTNPILKVRIAGADHLVNVKDGTNLDAAIPALIGCLNYESTDTNSVRLQYSAAGALGVIAHDPEQVVPALIQKLTPETSFSVRVKAAAALGQFGKYAQEAVPELQNLTNGNDVILRSVATHALEKIEKDKAK